MILPILFLVLGALSDFSSGKMRPFVIGDLRTRRQRSLTTPTGSFNHAADGSVLTGGSTLETLPPNVVFNYLSGCAQVELDFDSCIVSTFLGMTFNESSSFGTLCNKPARSVPRMKETFADANTNCLSMTGNSSSVDNQEAADALWKVITDELCWWGLCENSEITLAIESSWIKTCANITLPYPEASVEDAFGFLAEESFEDTTVTCMLDFVMASSPSDFGLLDEPSGSIDRCSPPGYNSNMAEICHDSIARPALEKCYTTHPSHNHMSYNYEDSLSYNYGPEHHEHAIVYMEKLCSLLTELSNEKGRECLFSLCDIDDPTPVPSVSLSISPTAPPSTHPVALTEAPSQVLTSVAPTTVTPTRMPTLQPTFSDVQKVVEAVLTSTFTLDGNFTDVPTLGDGLTVFTSILENSITSTLSNISGTARARVDALNGNPVRRRRLYRKLLEGIRSLLLVEFTVLVSRDCYLEVCTGISTGLLQEYEDELEDTIRQGSLTAAVRGEAISQGATILESATVTPDSYIMLSSTSNVRLPLNESDESLNPNEVIGNNDNNDDTTSNDENSKDAETSGSPLSHHTLSHSATFVFSSVTQMIIIAYLS